MPNPLSIINALKSVRKVSKLKAIDQIATETSGEVFLQGLRDNSLALKGKEDVLGGGLRGLKQISEPIEGKTTVFNVEDVKDIEQGFSDVFGLAVKGKQGQAGNANFVKELSEDLVNDLQRASFLKKGEVGDAEAVAAIFKFTAGPQKNLSSFLNKISSGVSVADIPKRTQEILLGWDRALIKASTPLQEQATLFRSMTLEESRDVFIQGLGGEGVTLLEGREFVFTAHNSFSFSEPSAREFLDVFQNRKKGMLFILENAKNVLGIDTVRHIEATLGRTLSPKELALTSGLSKGNTQEIKQLGGRFINEAEFILQRQQPFRVSRIVDEADTNIVKVYIEPLENLEKSFIYKTRFMGGDIFTADTAVPTKLSKKDRIKSPRFTIQMPGTDGRNVRFGIFAQSEEEVIKEVKDLLLKGDEGFIESLIEQRVDIPALKELLNAQVQ